jgi:hypothetical protein
MRGLGNGHLLGAISEDVDWPPELTRGPSASLRQDVRKRPESVYGIDRNGCTKTSGIRSRRLISRLPCTLTVLVKGLSGATRRGLDGADERSRPSRPVDAGAPSYFCGR